MVNKSFEYLKHSRSSIDGVDDAAKCADTVSALGVLGLDRATLDEVYSILAAILWIGEMDIVQAEDGEGSCISDAARPNQLSVPVVEHVATLLKCDAAALEKCLTTRTVSAKHETFCVPLKEGESLETRDALAQAVYAKLFAWIVDRINVATKPPVAFRKINVLDIFGFELFEENGFEQLCINYANESLQQKFTHDVFKSLQSEYEAEGIDMDKIEFEDNADVLGLFEARLGILSLLDEECFRPKGNHESFVRKLMTMRADDKNLFKDRFDEGAFGVRHYANPVMYSTEQFLPKNQDALKPDVVSTLKGSSSSLVSSLFSASLDASRPPSSKRKSAQRRSSINSITVGGHFKRQLQELRRTVDETETHYIRCIKPNSSMSPTEFDAALVTEQLRCAGLIQAVQITRATYPNKMPIETCMERFGVLQSAKTDDSLDQLLRSLLVTEAVDVDVAFEVGRTKVYFASGVLEKLEAQRAVCLKSYAVLIQTSARGWFARRRYLCARRRCIEIQACIRRTNARTSYLRKRSLAITVQSLYRGTVGRRRAQYAKSSALATKIQAWTRMRFARGSFVHLRQSAIVVQSCMRVRICKKKCRRIREEKDKQASLQGQLEALQDRLRKSDDWRRPKMEWTRAADACAAFEGFIPG